MIKLTQLFSERIMPRQSMGSADISTISAGSVPNGDQSQEFISDRSTETEQSNAFENELYNVYESSEYQQPHEQNSISEESVAKYAEEDTREYASKSTGNDEKGTSYNVEAQESHDSVERRESDAAAQGHNEQASTIDTRLKEVEKAMGSIKEAIELGKKEIVSLLKKFGVTIDPKELTPEKLTDLKKALQALTDESPGDAVQLNELLHSLTELAIPFEVAPRNVMAFDISGKKEVSFLGEIPKKATQKLATTIEQLEIDTKKVTLFDNKRAELRSLKDDSFLTPVKEEKVDQKSPLMDKLKEMFQREPTKAPEQQVRQGAVKAEVADQRSTVGTEKQDTNRQQGVAAPQEKQTGEQKNEFFQQNSSQRDPQEKQSSKGTVVDKNSQGGSQQTQVKGGEFKSSESVNVEHTVKVNGEKIVVEKTKEVTQGRGAQQTHVVKQVVKNVTLLIDSGKTSMSMQLKPEHLGRVNIDIQMEDSKMKLSLKVETEGARLAVEGNVGQLKESLNLQGITIEDVEVEVRKESEFANLNDREEEQNRFKGNKRVKDSVTLEVDIEKDGAETGRRLGYNTMEYLA
ncbi:MAG: flagellar hook-length control protein FliK [Fibrobacterales bacterium]